MIRARDWSLENMNSNTLFNGLREPGQTNVCRKLGEYFQNSGWEDGIGDFGTGAVVKDPLLQGNERLANMAVSDGRISATAASFIRFLTGGRIRYFVDSRHLFYVLDIASSTLAAAAAAVSECTK